MRSGPGMKEWFASLGGKIRDFFIRIKDNLKHANKKEFDVESIKEWFSETASRIQQRYQELKTQEPKLTWNDVRAWLLQNGRSLAIYLLLPGLGIVVLLIIQNQTQMQINTMNQRQAQLTTIQTMIQKSKLSSLSGDPSPPMNDNEVETIRIMLQNRGISPNVLRLNLGRNGASEIEMQADQVPFGQWIVFLDEAAHRWDLFPVDLNVVAGDSPEIVSIRAVLQQTAEGN